MTCRATFPSRAGTGTAPRAGSSEDTIGHLLGDTHETDATAHRHRYSSDIVAARSLRH
jgi:hypothetical protein